MAFPGRLLMTACLLLGQSSWAFVVRQQAVAKGTALPATIAKKKKGTTRPTTCQSVAPSREEETTRSGKKLSKNRKKYIVRSMFKQAKALERKGRWRSASEKFHQTLELDPYDSYSHLGLARLEARREKHDNARKAFRRGTSLCPTSIHLWQAWAVYEEAHQNIHQARQLFEQALVLDAYNPYVCHAYGLMQKRENREDHAQQLWQRALQKTSTAALVCSLGELFIGQRHYQQARDLYAAHLPHLDKPKDKMEVYLAMAWLEERYYQDIHTAQDLLQAALAQFPTSSIAHVALARLEGRQSTQGKRAVVRRLANACREQNNTADGGRLYNAWAHIEVKDRRFDKARRILAKGIKRYPKDPMLLQAAGNVEQRVGNFTAARNLYSASLALEPTAPTLVAYALLQLRLGNYNYVKGLFEEALLLDPRHGPAYNAYGTAELRHGTVQQARQIFERGVQAQCADAASIYHGYAKLELSLGNVHQARDTLRKGLQQARLKDVGMDSQHRERALFLSHTLGMIELNSNQPLEALKVFQDGMTRYGNSSQLLLGAALCEVKLGKLTWARQLFEQAVLHGPKHAQAWQAWGVMEMRAGNITTARKLFDCGIKSVPNHGALWQAYATMESRLGEVETARSLFVAGIRKAPRHFGLYQGWASLELRADNFVTAKRLVYKSLNLNKHNGHGWIVAASIEQRLGNFSLAGLLLRRGIECAPTDGGLYRAYGDHLVQKGDIESAREVLEKGIEVDPLHAPTYHSLAELEARVFNVEGLAKLNRKAAEIFTNDATKPSPSFAQAWGAKIRARRRRIPKGVVELAEKVVENEEARTTGQSEDEDEFLDAFTALETIIIEDELITGDLLKNNNTTEI